METEVKKPFAPKLSRMNPRAQHNKGVALRLKNDGEETGEVIYVRGKYSDVAEQLQKRATREMQKQFKRDGKLVPKDPDEQHEDRIAYAVACTIGWEEIDGEDGKPLEFNAANAAAKYQFDPRILDIVDEGIANDTRFMKG